MNFARMCSTGGQKHCGQQANPSSPPTGTFPSTVLPAARLIHRDTWAQLYPWAVVHCIRHWRNTPSFLPLKSTDHRDPTPQTLHPFEFCELALGSQRSTPEIYFTILNDIEPDSAPPADFWIGVISSHRRTGPVPWPGLTIEGAFDGNPPAAARDISVADNGVNGIPTAVTPAKAKACAFDAPLNPKCPVAWAKDNAGTKASTAAHVASGRFRGKPPHRRVKSPRLMTSILSSWHEATRQMADSRTVTNLCL